jgi:hypothetical protein
MRNWFLIFLVLAVIGGFYYKFSFKDSSIDKAYVAYENGDWEEAKHLLTRGSFTDNHSLPLYIALIASAKEKFQESDKFLSAIENSLEGHFFVKLIRCLNYAKTEQFDLLTAILSQEEEALSPYLYFFKGYLALREGKFAESLTAWEGIHFEENPKNSLMKWYACLFERFFPKQAREIFLAQALIECSEFEKAHTYLEKNCFSSFDSEYSSLQQLSTLLLGFNHMQQGLTLSANERESHFKVALFYFTRCAKVRRYPTHAERAHACIVQAVLSLLNEKEESFNWACAFIEILQNWNLQPQLDLIAAHLAKNLDSKSEVRNIEILDTLQTRFSDHIFYQSLIKSLSEQFNEALEALNIDRMYVCAQRLSALRANSQIMLDLYLSSTNALSRFIEKCDAHVTEVHHLVDFWETLNLGERYRRHYAELLLHQAHACWLKNGFEDHGLNLMHLSLKVSQDHEQTKEQIESFLLPLYEQAEKNNMLRRLSKIYDALEAFSIQPNVLACSEKIANHLADAQFQFLSKNWIAALSHAGWILKHEPQNTKARRIAGLSAFYLGEHAQAFHLLSSLIEKDKAVQYAIAFSSAHLDMHNSSNGIVQGDSDDPYSCD